MPIQNKTNPVVDWQRVETVLLDMDGTILDLHFDNQFWTAHLPQRYAELHGLELEESHRQLAPVFSENAGQLTWYCTDFWSDHTGLNVAGLKREIAELIGPLPGAVDFLDVVRNSGRRLWLVTNAHRDSVNLKLERTGLEHYFEHVISSHDFGFAKEDPRFWPALQQDFPFDYAGAIFVDDSPAVVANAVASGLGQVVALSHPDSRDSVREHSHVTVARRLADISPVNA